MVGNFREHQKSGTSMRWQSSQVNETVDPEYWGRQGRQELCIHSEGPKEVEMCDKEGPGS